MRIAVVLLVGTLAACEALPGPPSSGTPSDRTPSDARAVEDRRAGVDTAALQTPDPAEDLDRQRACWAVATGPLALHTRPSAEADRAGTLAPGDSARATGRAPGWIGIAPGTAQAANVGPFRLRYVRERGPLDLHGDCTGLEPQPPVDPTACYEMAMGRVALHARPSPSSPVVGEMPSQSFAVATERTEDGWVRVAPSSGQAGWVAPADVNLNGSTCSRL